MIKLRWCEGRGCGMLVWVIGDRTFNWYGRAHTCKRHLLKSFKRAARAKKRRNIK